MAVMLTATADEGQHDERHDDSTLADPGKGDFRRPHGLKTGLTCALMISDKNVSASALFLIDKGRHHSPEQLPRIDLQRFSEGDQLGDGEVALALL